MQKYNKVVVCCPAELVTGGPELLHQFVHHLTEQGVDAHITYYPFCSKHSTPEAYKHYKINIISLSEIEASEDILIVIPETATQISKRFPNNSIAIWWLSVDNYFGYPLSENNIYKKGVHWLKILLGKKLSLRKMREMIHFYQSEYARLFLQHNNITALSLKDYLNKSHMDIGYANVEKENVILYNPKKGIAITNKLKENFREFQFKPIENMTASEVRITLERSKLYIDFGHHPGKDRFPREAVMAGCVLITGVEGSAANEVDIPIPSRFKLDSNKFNFESEFKKCVDNIFSNFQNEIKEFEYYRNCIKNEEQDFRNDVTSFVRSYIKQK